ncbi:MAG: hypothetical protein WBW81_06055 [Methylocella sp.]
MFNKIFILALVLLDTILAVPAIEAAESNCTQNRVDGTTIPPTNSYMRPTQTVIPFYQWENDNGYCGEVSMMQAGLNHGQWMSQFNARLVCGATLPPSQSSSALLQSGPNGWCSSHKNLPNYNAQLLIEDPNTGVSGQNPYANAATCLANSRLLGTTYPYSTGFRNSNLGLSGYQDYLSWVKSEVIAGHQVTVGILFKLGTDPQYDHEVSVIKIGTNHPTTDPTYYDDDVLYFDDHGGYDLVGKKLGEGNPAIPLGSGSDSTGCTPYVFGYTFGSLAQTRRGANVPSAQAYSIVIPGVYPTDTSTGGDGYLGTIPITGHNYGFSVSGAIDNSSELMPIQLSIPSATYTNGVSNPLDPVAGWQYENSMIGTSLLGTSCTNTPPQYWMVPLTLQPTVSGLTLGTTYNLYEYDFSGIVGTGSAAALAVPTANFNQNASMATYVTQFTATGPTYSKTITRTSNQIIVFRAVPANAP